MKSLYDELSEKLAKDPRLTKRGGPRYDLGLLLFDFRGALRDLWDAADRSLIAADRSPASAGHGPTSGRKAEDDLRNAVERLRPLFGERAQR